MNETPGMPEAPKKSNTGLIIGAVVAVLLCCCCLSLFLLYTYGDQIMQSLGVSF